MCIKDLYSFALYSVYICTSISPVCILYCIYYHKTRFLCLHCSVCGSAQKGMSFAQCIVYLSTQDSHFAFLRCILKLAINKPLGYTDRGQLHFYFPLTSKACHYLSVTKYCTFHAKIVLFSLKR